MLKKYSQLLSFIFFGIFSMAIMNASAIDLDEATRTVIKDGSGNSVVLTPEQVKRGKRLFNATCGACHVGGITKTNPNVGLDPEALSLASPRRDNLDALVDYMKCREWDDPRCKARRLAERHQEAPRPYLALHHRLEIPLLPLTCQGVVGGSMIA